ncbi:MAG: hypothetical protein ACJ788_26725, partial [Ktedonobacteraceae bacterium]
MQLNHLCLRPIIAIFGFGIRVLPKEMFSKSSSSFVCHLAVSRNHGKTRTIYRVIGPSHLQDADQAGGEVGIESVQGEE